MKIRPEDIEFVGKAQSLTSRVEADAVLLLVGSRAAGFDDSWSDLTCGWSGTRRNFPLMSLANTRKARSFS
jgi:hypothetical protein